MAGMVLGDKTNVQRPSTTLILPPGVLEQASARCNICGKPFWEREMRSGGAYERHVVKCSEEHEEELREWTVAGRSPMFNDETFGDQELKKWVRDHREEIIDGRKRM